MPVKVQVFKQVQEGACCRSGAWQGCKGHVAVVRQRLDAGGGTGHGAGSEGGLRGAMLQLKGAKETCDAAGHSARVWAVGKGGLAAGEGSDDA